MASRQASIFSILTN